MDERGWKWMKEEGGWLKRIKVDKIVWTFFVQDLPIHECSNSWCSMSWMLIVRLLSVPCSMSGGSVSLSCLWWGRGVSTCMVKNSKYFKKLIIGGFPNVTENVTDEVKILWKILCLVNQIYSLNKCINHFARQSNQWLRRKNLCQYHFQFQGVSQRRFTDWVCTTANTPNFCVCRH